MKKTLKKGDVFYAWSVKVVGQQLIKNYGLDLNITGNNGNGYFKKRIEGKYNVYFIKHWSTFGEIIDAATQQITNIVEDKDHAIINEHWRGFAHPEVFDKYKTRGVKELEYKHNFNMNDGLRLVFAKNTAQSYEFWGVYELDKIDDASKTKVWKRVSETFPMFKAEAKKAPAKKPAAKKAVAKKVAKKPAKKACAKKPAKKAK